MVGLDELIERFLNPEPYTDRRWTASVSLIKTNPTVWCARLYWDGHYVDLARDLTQADAEKSAQRMLQNAREGRYGDVSR